MKKITPYRTLIALMILILALPSAVQSSIQAEGMAPIHKNFVDIARDRAIENAQRNAVEQAVGVMISSRTEVENFQVKLDQILSESEGYINSYKVVSEKRDGDTYRVTIEADVGMGKLKDRMTAINLIMARKSKPRLMLIFAGSAQKDAVAEAAMSSYLFSRGFKLVDAETNRKNSEYERLQAAGNNQKAAMNIAQRYGAEVLLVGAVEATHNAVTISNIEMNTNNVVVTGKVINGDTGEVLATGNEKASAPGVKGDIRDITEDASRRLAAKLTDEVLNRWSSELTNPVTVKLLLSGLGSHQDVLRLKEILAEEVKGYKEAYQRAYSRGQVDLDVELKGGNAQGLAEDIAALTLNKRKIKILEITPNRIKARILH